VSASISDEQLVTGSPSATIAITSDGITLTWSPSAERILGIATDEALGKPLSDLAGTGDLVFGDGVLEAFGRHRSGRALSLVIAIRPLDASRWIVTITDMTLLRARDKATDTQRLKRERLGAITHELHTPLDALAKITELLIAGKAGPISPEQQEYLEQLLSHARKLAALIEDALAPTVLS
jgi:signal transduction histidine kinase